MNLHVRLEDLQPTSNQKEPDVEEVGINERLMHYTPLICL